MEAKKVPVHLQTVQALAIAQQFVAARERRYAADKVAAALKEAETLHKTALMTFLETEGINSIGDVQFVYALVKKDEPQVDDWAKLYKHIEKTGEFELLFRRINPASVKERWDLKKKVPGVSSFPVTTLSVTKAKS